MTDKLPFFEEEPRPRGFWPWLRERTGDMTPLEQVLWAVAGLLAIVAAVVFFSTLSPGGAPPSQALVSTPIAPVASLTRLPSSTLTPSPSSTLTPSPAPTSEPLIIPTPPANGVQLSFSPVPDWTGWFGSRELGPHWRDRNLHSGTYQGQSLLSVLQFDLRSLAPGSRILFAALEMSGRNAKNLGTTGRWKADLIENRTTAEWEDASYDTVSQAKTLATLGSPLTVQNLAAGQTNHFRLGPNELALLQKQLDSGIMTVRLSAVTDGSDSLFTWDAGPGPGEPTLSIIAVPASFTVITVTSTPISVYAAATQAAQQTQIARQFGTPTPFPRSIATATPGATGYIIVTEVPTPLNAATAAAQSAYATAVAFTTGTFTPTPPNVVVVTATPTPPFLVLNQFTPVPTRDRTAGEISLLDAIRTPIPASTGLIGNIAFLTDREGGNTQVWVIDKNGAVLGKLAGDEYYRIAAAHDLFSPDKLYHLDVGRAPDGRWMIPLFDVAKGVFTPFIEDPSNEKGIGAYHPAWSPAGDKVAFVSERTGYSEIYVYDVNTRRTARVTNTQPDPRRGYPPYNKHPSWSPDGNQIVFFSDRDAADHKQIWIMNADGGGLRNLSPSVSNDWDPVWIKK